MTVAKSVARKAPIAARPAERLQHPYRLLFLRSPNCPDWFSTLPALMHQANLQTHICTESATYEASIDEFQPDVIIGYAHTECLNLFTALILVDPRHRPLCVLVETDDSQTINPPADIICLSSARTLRRQMESMLYLRSELRKAESLNEKLRKSSARQRQKIKETERRLQHDITALADVHSAELQQIVTELKDLQQRWESHQQYIKKLEDKIKETDVLRTAIFGNVVHEFSTPLLQLKGSIISLRETDPDNRFINWAIHSVAKLENSVQNITQLASMLDIKLAPMVIREILQAAARKVENSLLYKDSADRVQIQIEDRLPAVLGNNKGLVAVVQRLIDNALKFSEDTPVIVAAYLEDGQVVVSIQDFGIGIAPKDIPLVFDMFYQVDGSCTRQFGGMGIGLAIVRTILEKHETQIEVDSELGKGSTFRFRLKPVNLRQEFPR